ncbi:conserved hypothetical protein [Formosa agariphila KMM 3901]|uniref:Bacterial EndoU nuclease domain-containing protein n=1 Tax=Formosa agariphila (strain DSM 15362 / KCTC 12365 / LMG 23005 / KMM 3901 / M-2Alg 35-1) TaxID=1347342 RepID=T2KIC1_FORAG|nr:EndoU domain-containing protein [Formosa agariphila]CDF78550.1 conserved hypothetical protein [Formosa agariphila KMM 3901]
MKFKYYILKNTFINDKQGLKPGVRINKIPAMYTIKLAEGEGPFNDLPTLKRKSTIYRNIVLRNPKRAEQICLEKNITEIKDLILTKKNSSVDLNFVEIFEHCIKGQVKKGKVSGVHYYNSERVKILKLIKQNNKTGIWEAEIEFLDKKTNTWVKKEKSTTFFPRNWSMHQLFHECEFAVEHKQKVAGKKNVFISQTVSGIEVEIIIINDKMRSIYPLLN